MKKIFTLIMFAAVAFSSVVAQNANLLKNPGFTGEWNDKYGQPEGWTCYRNGGSSELLENTPSEGVNAVQLIAADKETVNFGQYVNTIEVGKKYVISYDYKVVNATGNTCRLWARWQHYVSNSEKNWVDPTAEDKEKMQMSGYLDAGNNEWQHVSYEVTAHDESITTLHYEFRVYGGATVQFANPYLGLADGTGLTDANAAKTGIYAYDGTVVVLANESGVAEVYNLLGEKVKSVMVEEGSNEISDLARGQVYVVRYGNKVQKVIL